MQHPLRPSDPTRLGPYQLIARLGQGGMGVVFLGRDSAGRSVAVKVLRDELSYDEEFRRRFRSEVNRAREVPPFCTAEMIDADPDHDPPYLVVEYVDGPSLATVIEQRGCLRGAELHSVAVGIATALTAIHSAGVIHRDLKPDNVLFAFGGVKVIDFGIARPVEVTSNHTRTDQMVGTVSYMAPERFDTAAGRAADPAADIFAWGAVVAFAGTGRTPFAADSPQATAMRILTQPPNLTGLDGPLFSLVARALEKDPQRRPTARELIDLLLAYDPPLAPVSGAPDVPVIEFSADWTRWVDRSRRSREGFRTFVTEQRTGLRDLAYLICGDWQVAEEVATNALARSYPRWHKVRRPDLQVKTTIVRAATKESSQIHGSAAVPASAIGSGSPSAIEHRRRLRTAMMWLAPWQRAALGMAFAMRMSPEEIGVVLGWHPQHVDAQIRDGLLRLQTFLGDEYVGSVAPSRDRA